MKIRESGPRYVGRARIELNGLIVCEIGNLVVTDGKVLAASRLISNTANFIDHMAIGSVATTPAPGDHLLGNELARLATTNSSAGAVATMVTTFPPGTGTGNIVEAGLFNIGTANTGTMMSRIAFAAIPKTDDDELKITWTIEAQ
jgi:hypothetical protein